MACSHPESFSGMQVKRNPGSSIPLKSKSSQKSSERKLDRVKKIFLTIVLSISNESLITLLNFLASGNNLGISCITTVKKYQNDTIEAFSPYLKTNSCSKKFENFSSIYPAILKCEMKANQMHSLCHSESNFTIDCSG